MGITKRQVKYSMGLNIFVSHDSRQTPVFYWNQGVDLDGTKSTHLVKFDSQTQADDFIAYTQSWDKSEEWFRLTEQEYNQARAV